MSGGDCGCGCNGSGGCGGGRNWSAVTSAPQAWGGRVDSAMPLMAGIDDDPESLSPEATSPPIELPSMPSMPSLPSLPSLPSSIPSWVPWAAGGLLVYLLVR